MSGKRTSARRVPGRERKSLRLQAASVPGLSAAVEEEEYDDSKPYAPGPNVKLEGGDGEDKPDISTGRQIVHDQSRQSRRRRGGQCRDSRYEYIMSTAQQMKPCLTDAVSGVGEMLFHNVFNCLIDAVVAPHTEGTEEKTIEVKINSGSFNSVSPFVGQENYLKKILTLLHCMARMRIYDPPSENEAVYYREIKKHIRCMVAYNEAKENTKDGKCAYLKDPASYHRMSCSQTISAVEELIELNDILAEISPHIWDLNHKNDAAPDVAIHVSSSFKDLPAPNWSTEKVKTFYYNKLILALHDVKCSGLADLSPESNEQKSFDALQDYVSSSSMHVRKADEMAASSYKCKAASITPRKRERETMEVMLFAPGGINTINGLFDGRLFEYVDELRRSCVGFMLRIMKKLGTVVCPEKLHWRFGKDAEYLINQLANTQMVHQLNSPDYIEGIDQCILLARYVASLTKGISSSIQVAFANLSDILQRKQYWSEFAPEALRVLMLLDCGAFRKAKDKIERPLHTAYISSYDNATETMDNMLISLGSSKDNIKVLAIILHILKDIGTTFMAPSPGEMMLLEQILEHVSLCIDGFLSTMAYHKERELNFAPASTLTSKMRCINDHGMIRGMPAVYSCYGGKYLVESLFRRFELVQEDVNLLIPSLQNFKAALMHDDDDQKHV